MSDPNPTQDDQPKKTGAAALDDVFAPFDRSDAPGLVVGVAQRGAVVYRKGFGLASLEANVANTPWTRMRIGSTTKHFACLAAMLLAEDGRLDLDASASRYVPELQVDGAQPTLRQFMNHTSGLRCGLDAGFLSEGLAVRPAGSGLAGQVRMRDVNFAPGEKFMYNNGGYHLLSLAIERVSGLPFGRFLAERIFAPLGMVDTLLVPNDFEIHRGMATLHVRQPDGTYKRGIFPSMEVLGEGGMASTVDDMLRWLAHLRGPKKVGSEATWAQMTAPTRLANGVTVPYGFGLMRHAYRGVTVIHHAGAVIGGACQMLTVPEHGLDIVILSNGAPASPHELAKQVVDAMLGDGVLGAPLSKVDSKDYAPLLGRRYVGRDSRFVVGFEDVAGELGLSLLNLPAMPMRAVGATPALPFEDVAAGPFVLASGALDPQADAPASIRFGEAGVPEPFDLLAVAEGEQARLAADLPGQYAAADLDAVAEIRRDGDALAMDVKGEFGRTAMTLEAIGTDLLAWRMGAVELPLRGIAHVHRGADGRVESITIDTTRTRGMRFARRG